MINNRVTQIPSGYKQTEIGVIPEDWDIKNLGGLFEITSSKRVFQSEWRSSGVPFYRARELAVLGEKGKVENELFIDEEMYQKYKNAYGVPNNGDFLITGVGTLGKVYVVVNDHKFYFKDGNIIWFKINKKLDSEYLKQLYLTPFIERQIIEMSAGSTVGTYTITGAKKTLIPFPAIPEQTAIATALSDTDALTEKLEKLIAKKKAIKQGAMQQLLTGKKRLPGFSGEWEVKKLGEIAQFYKGKGLPKSEIDPNGKFNCIHYGELFTVYNEVIKNIVSKTNKKEGLFLSKVNDILMPTSDVTPTGLATASCVNVNDVILGGDVLVIRPLDNVLDGAFFAYGVSHNRNQVMQLVSGSTVYHLYGSDMKKYEFNVPPTLEEQTAIATAFSDMDTEITKLENKLSKYRQIKIGMMQQLLTGKIRLVKK